MKTEHQIWDKIIAVAKIADTKSPQLAGMTMSEVHSLLWVLNIDTKKYAEIYESNKHLQPTTRGERGSFFETTYSHLRFASQKGRK